MFKLPVQDHINVHIPNFLLLPILLHFMFNYISFLGIFISLPQKSLKMSLYLSSTRSYFALLCNSIKCIKGAIDFCLYHLLILPVSSITQIKLGFKCSRLEANPEKLRAITLLPLPFCYIYCMLD